MKTANTTLEELKEQLSTATPEDILSAFSALIDDLDFWKGEAKLNENFAKIAETRLMAIKQPNVVQCLECGDVLASTHNHDFVTCTCKNLSIDGGYNYQKVMYKEAESFRRFDVEDLVSMLITGHVPDLVKAQP